MSHFYSCEHWASTVGIVRLLRFRRRAQIHLLLVLLLLVRRGSLLAFPNEILLRLVKARVRPFATGDSGAGRA